MMRLKSYYSTVLLLLSGFTAMGAPICREKAQDIAESFVSSSLETAKHVPSSRSHKPGLQLKKEIPGGYFAYNIGDGEGYVIVSADDRMPSIVGYANSGRLGDEFNPVMLNWLNTYCEYVASLTSDANQKQELRQNIPGLRVEPLCRSQWGQNAPFNALCPLDADKNRCMTGCVATALAQILYYHKYPSISTGSGTYQDPVKGMVSYTFGQNPYRWQKMKDKYEGNVSADERDAISLLLFEAGVCSRMMYTIDGSGALIPNAACGIVDNLGYSRNVRYLNREFCSRREWLAVLRNQIESGQPVLFGGQSQSGGHAFVCDGIDENDYVHINWGWTGEDDGYYNVDYMHPDKDDYDGFNYYQEIVYNIRPADDDEVGYEDQNDLFLRGDLGIKNLKPGRNASFMVDVNKVSNLLGRDWSGELGLMLFRHGLGVRLLKSFGTDIAANATFEKKTLLLNVPGDVAEGQYELRLVHRHTEGDWKSVNVMNGVAGILLMDISVNEISIKPQQVRYPDVPDPSEKHTLIMEITATDCPNCPRIATQVEEAKEIYPELVDVLSVHGDYSGKMADPMLFADYKKLTAPYGSVYPSAVVDMSKSNTFTGNFDVADSKFMNRLDVTTSTALTLNATFDSERKALITVSVTPEDNCSGLAVVVALTEDGIRSPQSCYDEQTHTQTVVSDYVHNNVLREMVTPLFGEEIYSTWTEDEGCYTKTYAVMLSDKYDMSSLKAMAWVLENADMVTSRVSVNSRTTNFSFHSGIGQLSKDEEDMCISGPVQVYTLDGRMVMSSYENEMSLRNNLNRGLYIVRHGSKCKKIVIK